MPLVSSTSVSETSQQERNTAMSSSDTSNGISSLNHSTSCTSTVSIISMQQRPKSNHHSSRNDQCNGLSVALQVQCYDSVHRYLLPSQLCQSLLNGRNGSNACTVISVYVTAQIVQDHLQIPSPGLRANTTDNQRFH